MFTEMLPFIKIKGKRRAGLLNRAIKKCPFFPAAFFLTLSFALLAAFKAPAAEVIYSDNAVKEEIGPGLVSSALLEVPEGSGINLEALSYEVFTLVNQARAENGLNELNWSEKALPAAALRAYECALAFSHTRPGNRRFYTAFDETGVTDYLAVGENIAIGQESAEEVMADWMGSETHRANILSEDFEELAVALTYTSNGIIWVQEFYTQKPSAKLSEAN